MEYYDGMKFSGPMIPHGVQCMFGLRLGIDLYQYLGQLRKQQYGSLHIHTKFFNVFTTTIMTINEACFRI
jgi:hypothetical protein